MAEPQGPPGGGDIEVEAPDGKRIAFPSSMSKDDIGTAMRKLYPPQNQSEPKAIQGLPAPPFASAPSASASSVSPSSGGSGASMPSGSGQQQFDEAFASGQVAPAQPLPPQEPKVAAPPSKPYEPDNWARIYHANIVHGDVMSVNDRDAYEKTLNKRVLSDTQPGSMIFTAPPETQALNSDPRRDKVFADYKNYLAQNNVGGQGGLDYITSKQATGEWTDKDAADLEEKALRHQAGMLEAHAYHIKEMDAAGTPVSEEFRNEVNNGVKYLKDEMATLVMRHPEVAAEKLENDMRTRAANQLYEQNPELTPFYQIQQPAMQAANKYALNILRAPRSMGGDEYGWTDALAEWAEDSYTRMDARVPERLKGPLVKDGKFDYENALPKISSTLTSMALLVGGGGGTSAGLVGNAFMQEHSELQTEAMKQGLKQGEALQYTVPTALGTSLLELVSPQGFLTKGVTQEFGQIALKAMIDGKTTKEAFKEGFGFIAKEIGQENAQELSQLFYEKAAASVANSALGLENPAFDKFDDEIGKDEIVETVLLTTVASGIMAGGAKIASNPIAQSSVQWATEHPDQFKAQVAASRMTPEAKQKATERVDELVSIRNGIPKVPDKEAGKLISLIDAKRQAAKSAVITDEAVTAVQGDPAIAVQAAFDDAIHDIVGTPPVEKDAQGNVKEDKTSPAQQKLNDAVKKELNLTGEATPKAPALPQPPVEEGGVDAGGKADDVAPVDIKALAQKVMADPDLLSVTEEDRVAIEENMDAIEQEMASAGEVAPVHTSGKWKVFREGEDLVIRDKDGNEPSDATASKVMTDMRKNYNYAQGKTIADLGIESQDEGDVSVYLQSENPAEIAAVLAITEKEIDNEGSFKEQMIAQVIGGGRVQTKSFTGAAGFGAEDVGGKKGERGSRKVDLADDGKALDMISLEASGLATGDYNANEPYITEEDVVDWVNKYGSVDAFNRKVHNPLYSDLRDRFKTLTGFAPTPAAIERAIQQHHEGLQGTTGVQSDPSAQGVGQADAQELGTKEVRATDPQADRLAAEVDAARAARDAFVNDFNDRGQGLFAPGDIPTKQQTIDDTIDNSKENFDAKVEPLNERVRQATKALADYVERGADRAAAAAKQTSIPNEGGEPPFQRTATPKTGIGHVDKVLKALEVIAPGITVTLHKDPSAFAKASKEAGGRGLASDAAFYDPKANAIHINMKLAGDNTLFHEASHPLLRAAIANDPTLLHSLFDGLSKHPDGAKYKEFGAQYGDKPISEKMQEALAEFLADVASGKVKSSSQPDSLWQRFKAWLNDMLSKLGFSPGKVNISDNKDLRSFADAFAKAVNKGIRIEGVAPVGGAGTTSLQQDADAVVDGWYSRLDQTVAAKGNTQSGADWMKWAEARAKEGALSLEEVKWTGLADFLQGKAKVTPKDVREFLKDNRVKVEVVMLGVGAKYPDVDYEAEFGVRREDMTDEEREGADADVEREHAPNTKFGQYQLPGGTNYREVLVTLPATGMTESEYSNLKDEVLRKYRSGEISKDERNAQEGALIERYHGTRKDNFKSSHFDEPNILVHLRLNDRTGPNGEKVLFVEELQSDWGQAGKKKGFADTEAFVAEEAALKKEMLEIPSRFGGTMNMIKAAEQGDKSAIDARERRAEIGIRLRQIEEARGRVPEHGALGGPAPPLAPFVEASDAWVELGIKQAIRMAVDGGYDRIAWATGEQQYNRWGSQVFSWTKRGDNWYVLGQEQAGGDAFAGMEEQLSEQAFSEGRQIESRDDLRELVLATMGREKRDWSPENWKKHIDKITDGIWQQMKDGKDGSTMPRREGMKGFYDKILPTAAKKVSKKLGGDGVVGEVRFDSASSEYKVMKDSREHPYRLERVGSPDIIARFDTAEDAWGEAERLATNTQQSITITPAMRAKVSAGTPLFQYSDKEKKALEDLAKTKAYKAAPLKEKLRMQREAVGAVREKAAMKANTVGKKLPPKTQTNLSSGVTKPTNNILVDERTALKDQIRLEAKAASGAAKDIAKKREVFASRVANVISSLKDPLPAAQAKAITTRAAKVDPTNFAKVDKFLNYVGKVIEDVTYDAKLQEAEALRTRIAKQAGRKSAGEKRAVGTNASAHAFASIDPADTDIDTYLKYAQAISDNLKGVSVKAKADSSVQASNIDAAITNDSIKAYVAEQEAIADDLRNDRIMREWEQYRIDNGIEASSMTPEQMGEILEAAKSQEKMDAYAQKQADKALKDSSIRQVAKWKQGELATMDKSELSAQEKSIVQDVLDIDTSKLTPAQATRLITLSNDIAANNDFGGSRDFAAIGRRDRAIAKLKNIKGPSVFQNIEEGIRTSTSNTSALFERITRSITKAWKVKEAMGLEDLNNAQQVATSKSKRFRKAINNAMFEAGMKMRDDTLLNRYRMGMYALAIQHRGGTSSDQASDFQATKRMVQQSVERMNSDKAFDRVREKGKFAQQAYDEVFASAETAEDVAAKTDPKLKEVVGKVVDEFAKEEEASMFSALVDYNMDPERLTNYSPRSQVTIGQADKKLASDLFAERYFKQKVDNDPAAAKHERSDALRPGMALDLDFISVAEAKYHETVYDNETAQHVATIREILNDPEITQILGGPDTHSLIRNHILHAVASQRGDSDLYNPTLAKVQRIMDWTAKRSSGIALKGITQAIKQPTVLFNLAANLGTDSKLLPQAASDAMTSHREGTWQSKLVQQLQIGGRGGTLAGLEKVTDAISEKAPRNGDEAAVMSWLKDAGHVMTRAGDKLFVPMVATDVFAARTGFFAYYRQKLAEKDLEPGGEVDAEAAAYANHMVERTQGSNTTATTAQAYTADDATKLLTRIILPFSSFSLNQRKRFVSDIRILLTGAKEDKAQAAKDLAGTLAEQSAFNAVRIYAIAAAFNALGQVIASAALGDEDEEDKKKREAREDAQRTPQFVGSTLSDYIFSGMPNMARQQMEGFFNDVIKKAMGAQKDENGKPTMPPNVFYSIDNGTDFGVYNALLDQVTALKSLTPMLDGSVEDPSKGVQTFDDPSTVRLKAEMGMKGAEFEDKEAQLSAEQQAAAIASALVSTLAIAGYSDSEINRMNRVLRRRLEKAISEDIGSVKEEKMTIVTSGND